MHCKVNYKIKDMKTAKAPILMTERLFDMRKAYLYSFIIIFLASVIFPIPCAFGAKDAMPTETASAKNTFKVFLHDEKRVITLGEKEYICGVVAAEIGGDGHEEAIKAQAVAAYSMAIYTKNHGGDKKELMGADFSDDYATFQSYMSKEQFKKREGDSWEKGYQKIEKAVDEVYGEILTFEGEPAQTVYHAISSGRTESSEVAFGSKSEYLTPVPSVGDLLSKDYQSEVKISVKELKEALSEYKIKWTDDAKNWFSNWDISQSGTVKKVSVCGSELSGSKIRSALKLRSANFEVSFKDDVFTFICRGYGHGVGMSQNGAEYMAVNGSTYKEILSWYYSGCTIDKIR